MHPTSRREDIQLALVETLAELNRMFALRGILAGCTATLVLQARRRGGAGAKQLAVRKGCMVVHGCPAAPQPAS